MRTESLFILFFVTFILANNFVQCNLFLNHKYKARAVRNDSKHIANNKNSTISDIKPSQKPDPKDMNITRYPVILVPGDGGNQLHAKLNKSSAPHYLCKLKSSDYFLLWLNLQEITPYVLDCFIDNIQLVYDSRTRKTYNQAGVDIRVKGFGATDTVEYLDDSKYSATGYFNVITSALVKNLNYKRGVNVRGAPYDWRKAPNEYDEFYANLTRLVEETYEMNNQTRAILIAHSMGNPVTLYWLNNYVNQQWKDKYIRSFVSLSAPWGGAVKTLRLLASGDNIDIAVVKPINVRAYQRSATSTVYLMPSDKFWPSDEVLVSTPARNYTIKDYNAFFDDVGFPLGHEYLSNTRNLTNELMPPNVEIHCLYGVGMKTPQGFVYSKQKDFPDAQPSVTYGDGDGTVNLRSLTGYRRWIGKQSQPIFYKEFPGAEHVATLKAPAVVDYILDLFKN